MIIPEKKKAVSAIISRFGQKDPMKLSNGGPVGMEEAPDMSEAKKAHASSMIDAFHNKDPESLVHAMNSFLEEHQLHEEKDKEEPSDYKP